MSNDFQMIPVQGEMAYTFDFTDVMPDTSPLTTVTDIAFTATGGLTLGAASPNFGLYRSTVIVSGAVHGYTYTLQAIATLSNGEQIPKDATLLGFNA